MIGSTAGIVSAAGSMMGSGFGSGSAGEIEGDSTMGNSILAISLLAVSPLAASISLRLSIAAVLCIGSFTNR